MRTAPAGLPVADRREPLWTRVDRNRVRLAGYVALFVASAVVTAESMLIVFGGCGFLYTVTRMRLMHAAEWGFNNALALIAWSSGVVAIGALGWALFAINRSETWLVERFKAELVPKGHELAAKMALKDMAIAGGLPVAPAMYLLDDSSVNAFVFSARGRRPIVGVTSGLLTLLHVDEQRAVFANLVARIVSGDTIVDTGVAALMLPLNVYRDRTFEYQNRQMDREFLSRGASEQAPAPGTGGGVIVLMFLFGTAMAVVGSVFSALQRHRQRRAAEKADAEGMLLLKDPKPMLAALEKCVLYDNSVAEAGTGFSDLFYCWPGLSTNDDSDPEWERVARLREVLGVEGMVSGSQTAIPDGLLAPAAPRLD